MLNDIQNIDWEQFHFLRPQFLWLIIPLLLIYILSVWSVRDQVKWRKHIAQHLQPFMIKRGSETLKIWILTISLFGMIFGIVSVSGPTWGKIKIPGQIVETPVVIALDLSQSMMATDIQPNRLERAKFKILDLIEENPQARMSLVAFAGSAHTVVPLTKDYNIIKSFMDGLNPSMMPIPGTDMATALNMADTVTQYSKAPSTLIVFSDDFSEDDFEALQEYAKADKKLEIIPLNTPQGAEVPNFGGKGTMKDKNGDPVHSAQDPVTLQRLASVENITVNQMTLDRSDMAAIAKRVRAGLKFQEVKDQEKDEWDDKGFWFMIPFLIAILFLSRKGSVAFSIIVLMAFTGCAPKEKGTFKFQDLWFTHDYQAQKLSDKKEYKKASELYDNQLRKGVALYKSGDINGAIKAFRQDSTAYGAYNLGLAYYKNGNLVAAQKAFEKATELDPDMEQAQNSKSIVKNIMDEKNVLNPEEAQEQKEKLNNGKNKENTGPEDLGGGGQEATKEDMEKERLEEEVTTDTHTGEELEEVPEDLGPIQKQDLQKILIRDTGDDPTIFLKKKFAFQVKKQGLKAKNKSDKW
ncbi:membrane protein (plasmid) [Fulvitalea axinellae]|uniref:Membrane protein n=1 Tax=Fulvitalea axinellae TaxID=1182444 RepID=A0AAU9D6H3_9BACT|nr:membrane protein [Fulvitalea axinellae]